MCQEIEGGQTGGQTGSQTDSRSEGQIREIAGQSVNQRGSQTSGQTGGQTSGQTGGNSSVDAVLNAIIANPAITRIKLSEITGIAPSAVQKHINKLKKQKIIARRGGDFGGHWEILQKNH